MSIGPRNLSTFPVTLQAWPPQTRPPASISRTVLGVEGCGRGVLRAGNFKGHVLRTRAQAQHRCCEANRKLGTTPVQIHIAVKKDITGFNPWASENRSTKSNLRADDRARTRCDFLYERKRGACGEHHCDGDRRQADQKN